MIDSEAVILPNSNAFFESALIPMLSGFNPANDLYPEGNTALSIKVKEAIKILDFIQLNFNELFDEISELTINKDDEFEIILSEEPTRVILGKNDIQNKINIQKMINNSLVKVNDELIKKNRLELLQMLCKSFDNYLNFSKIESL